MKINNIHVKKSCSLHACLRHAMRFARWMGFFPVQGLNQLTANGTKFKVKCSYGIYNSLSLLGQVVMFSFSIAFFLNTQVTLKSLSKVVFFVMSLIAALSLVSLAKRWPKLMKLAEKTEQSLTMLELDNITITKSRVIAYVFIIISLVIHVLSINFSLKLILECLPQISIKNQILAEYAKIRLSYIFNYISYSTFYLVLAMIFSFQAIFLLNFIDVMTICFSIYITSYLNDLNKLIQSKKKAITISWSQLRENYSKLALLVKEIDDQLSIFVLLSFFTDLYFICVQLFSLLHMPVIDMSYCGAEIYYIMLTSPDYYLYYYTSYLFLLLRSVSLSLFAANVHNSGRKPIIPVYSVQLAEYDEEVHRFQLILRFTTVALSGKYFYVTRNTILKAISTIITYELVLLQFSKTYYKDDLVNNSTTTVGTLTCL